MPDAADKSSSGAVKFLGPANKPVEKRAIDDTVVVALKIVLFKQEAVELAVHGTTNDFASKVNLVGEMTMACTGSVEPATIVNPLEDVTEMFNGKKPCS